MLMRIESRTLHLNSVKKSLLGAKLILSAKPESRQPISMGRGMPIYEERTSCFRRIPVDNWFSCIIVCWYTVFKRHGNPQ